MKAIRIHEHGNIDVLKIDDLQAPQPAANEILIEIKTAALNHLDLWVRNGFPGVPLPIIMGSDGAGIIKELGATAKSQSGFSTEDEVFVIPFRTCGSCSYCQSGSEQMCTEYRILGEYLDGTHAEYLTIPWNYVLPKPRTLSWEETAAFPLAFLTAYHMLVKKVQLKPSDWILIWGASSGIGSAAVQIAKLYDSKIIATASSQAKMDFATRLGVDYTINYIVEDVSKRVKEITNNTGVNVIFEHVGQDSWPHSLRALAKGGKIITCGATTGPKVSIDLRHLFLKHQQIIGSTMGNRQDLIEIKNLIDDGKIKPIVYRSLPFNEIKKAHHLLEQNQQQGKIVISFDI